MSGSSKVTRLLLLAAVCFGLRSFNVQAIPHETIASTAQHGAQLHMQPKQRGSITIATFGGRTEPDHIRIQQENEWSHAGYFDLTDQAKIPKNAVVTRITVSYAQTSGHFALPKRAIFDHNDQGFYVNQYNGQTNRHNGKPVRQRWYVRFQTDTIWNGPAIIWPTVNIQFEY